MNGCYFDNQLVLLFLHIDTRVNKPYWQSDEIFFEAGNIAISGTGPLWIGF